MVYPSVHSTQQQPRRKQTSPVTSVTICVMASLHLVNILLKCLHTSENESLMLDWQYRRNDTRLPTKRQTDGQTDGQVETSSPIVQLATQLYERNRLHQTDNKSRCSWCELVLLQDQSLGSHRYVASFVSP